MSLDYEANFEKLEKKIDKIHDALIILARIDEKLVNHQDAISRAFLQVTEQDKRQDKFSVDLHNLGEKGRTNSQDIQDMRHGIRWIVGSFCTFVGAIIIQWVGK